MYTVNVKNEPCITVITATYNLVENKRVKKIRQCIESVHNQTYSHVEHIIIDGGSDDGSLDLLKKYVDLGWVRLYSEPDNGIYDAMNKGISKANGKYINFLNSDDFLHDTRGFEVNIAYLEDQIADYAYGDVCVLKSWGRVALWRGDLSKLLIGTHYCHQTMFVKTEVLRAVGGFDAAYPVSADSDLMIRLYAKKYKSVYVPFCFCSFRKGGFSTQHEKQMRIDHSTSFYKHIGGVIGLSERECFQLWHMQFFIEKLVAEQWELINKVPVEFGMKDLLREFIARNPHGEGIYSKRRFYFLNCLPILEQIDSGHKRCYLLFNKLCILKISEFNGKRKCYLFGYLLVFKVKFYC